MYLYGIYLGAKGAPGYLPSRPSVYYNATWTRLGCVKLWVITRVRGDPDLRAEVQYTPEI